MRTHLGNLALCMGVSIAAGCSEPAPPPGPAAPMVAKPTRDLSALNMCDLVRPEEVAAAASGKLATEPSWNGKACMYVIETADGAESYLLSVYPAAVAEALLQVQSPAEKGEKIHGPWDEGWLGPRAAGTGVTLRMVRHGDLAIESSGDRREVVLALGKLAGERIK